MRIIGKDIGWERESAPKQVDFLGQSLLEELDMRKGYLAGRVRQGRLSSGYSS